jgi:hypothetical protein
VGSRGGAEQEDRWWGSPNQRHIRGGGEKKVGMAALLDGEGAPGTSTAPGVALQLREGKERVRPYQI